MTLFNDDKIILDFDESINFTIKCDNIKEMEDLQEKLNIKTTKINCQAFLEKI